MILEAFKALPFFDPGSRLHFLSVGCTLLVALIFIFLKKKSFTLTWVKLKSYWLHPSAIVDYKVFIMNGLIKLIFFAPLLGVSYFFSKLTLKLLYSTFSTFGSYAGGLWSFALATAFAFVLDDFLRFFHHYLMHKVPFLWVLHKTHHSASVLTPFTLYRIHPLESAMATARNGMSVGVATGVFMFVFNSEVTLYTILDVNALAYLFNLIFGNLRHSHFQISFGCLEKVFISPKQHQIHHSNKTEHFDKNFGVVFSVWDRLFGSHLPSKNVTVESFGVDDLAADELSVQYINSKSILIKGVKLKLKQQKSVY